MTTILSFTVIILALILGGLIFYILKNKKNQEGIDPNSPEIIKLDSQINNLENTATMGIVIINVIDMIRGIWYFIV